MTAATPIVVLASGRGSNFDAIVAAIRADKLNAEICAVISDKADAAVLAKAKAVGIPAIALPVSEKQKSLGLADRRKSYDETLIKAIKVFSPRFLVMAGYMRVASSVLIESFRSVRGYTRIINIHPSLLPSFPGTNSYAQAYAHGAKITGVTVHLVEVDVDSGPICAQEAFSIADCKSAAEVEMRGLEVEHRLYPATLSWLLAERFELETRVQDKIRRLSVRPR